MDKPNSTMAHPQGMALKLKAFGGTGNTVRCNNQARVDGGVGQGYDPGGGFELIALDVVIPLTVAILLTFLPAPEVTWLERWRMGGVLSVLATV